MALIHRAKALLVASLAGASLSAGAHAQQSSANLYEVANIRVETVAQNAVEAKKQATTEAERRAARLLLARLTDFRAESRVPALSGGQLEGLVSDIDIQDEGVSGTTYAANFGVTFSERGTRALLAQYGVIPIEERGPEVLILPVYIEAGSAASSNRNPWSRAFAGLDLSHALVPGKLAPTRSDITAAIANAYAASPAASLAALKSQYHVNDIVMAVAESDGIGALDIRLIGDDGIGEFSLRKRLKSKQGVDQSLIEAGAKLVFAVVQQRWKLTRAEVAMPGAQSGDGGQGVAVGSLIPVEVTAEYSGLREWQAIREKLQNLPGVQNWDLKSVNPRAAIIGFDFPGGTERLAEFAATRGLSVENGPNGWVVKTR
jgi:hypothetical protein